MRTAFVTPWDVHDPRAWSGIVHHMYQSLAAMTDVVPVVTGRMRPAFLDRMACRLCGLSSQKHYLVGHALATSRKRARALASVLGPTEADVILAVAASQDTAFLKLDRPVVSVSDATFRVIRGYYPLYSELCGLSSVQGEILESRSLRKSSRCLFATEWARQSALDDYAVPTERCRVIPFGPGLEPGEPQPPRSLRDRRLRVLVVAGDWKRKGGDLALGVYNALSERGLPLSLTIVGNAPPLPPSVTALGPVDADTMTRLYETHDVLLELARANCTGITLTDAAAFGIPVIATRTGGVATVVEHGVTGLLLEEMEDLALAVEQALMQLLSDETYATMSAQARRRYEHRLNWGAWARDVLKVLEEAAAMKQPYHHAGP